MSANLFFLKSVYPFIYLELFLHCFSVITAVFFYLLRTIFFFLFQLTLTSHVTEEDFQLGYSMSGHLERSFEKYISFQITHLAFVRRRDYFQDHSDPSKSNTTGASGSNTGSQSKTARFVKNLCRVYLSSK